jgi:hypothetical protein
MDGRPYSMDLRERVIQAVEREGLSRRQAAERFGVGIKTAIDWVRRVPGDGQRRPRRWLPAEEDRRSVWRLATGELPAAGIQLAWPGRRVGRARPAGRLPHGLGLRSPREAQL